MHRIRSDFQIKGLKVAALSFCVAAMAAASVDEVLDPDSKLARKKERDAALRSLNAIASAVGADTVALRANGNPLVESPLGMAERRLGTFGTRRNPLEPASEPAS